MPSPPNIILASPWWLLLLALLPVITYLCGREGTSAAVTFSSLHLVRDLGPPVHARAGRFRSAWIFIPLALAIVAMARPQRAISQEEIKESGIEMIMALDISRSMLVDDFFIGGTRVTRLQAARKVTKDFIDGRPADRIGLVAFAGRPYLASPITLDHDWLLDSMARVKIGMVEDGTAIGSAVAACAKRLDPREAKSKVIVLLTDGASNSGNLTPKTAAQLAKTLGIKIYAIAVGTHGPHRVPTPQGATVISQEFDEGTLKEIAAISGGAFYRAQDTDNLERIFDIIDNLEKTELSRRTIVKTHDIYPWFLGAAFLASLFLFIGRDTFARRSP